MNGNGYLGIFLFWAVMTGFCLIPPGNAATTELHIVRYADDGTTIINETTVSWQWMRDNLPVLGDGTTHYYHQGPVFIDNASPATQEALRWNPAEDTNVEEKDYGAVQGTNLKDLCELAGGLSPGEEVALEAIDGLTKKFAYRNVYEYTPRQGPMVITWSRDGSTPDAAYDEGMKLVFFADAKGNPWGIHAFGNYDWHESADSKYWYYYYQGAGNKYPTTTGLSVKYISEVLLYSNTPASAVQPPDAAFSAAPVSGNAPLTVQFTDLSAGSPTGWAWDFTSNGSVGSTSQNPSFTYTAAGTYSVTLTAMNAHGNSSTTKTDYIVVTAPAGSAPAAAFSATPRHGEMPLAVKFTDHSTGGPSSWAWDFTDDGIVDSTDPNPSYTYAKAGTYTVNLTVANDWGTTSEVKNEYITVTTSAGTAPVAAFSATPVTGSAPLIVQFTDLSTGSPTSWAWDFANDGVIESREKNPRYTFPGAGTYTVNLTVSGAGGSDSVTKGSYIRVSAAQAAEVTASPSAQKTPGVTTIPATPRATTVRKSTVTTAAITPAEPMPDPESPGPGPAMVVATLIVTGLLVVLTGPERYRKR